MKNLKKGFTLIELLIVLVLIAIVFFLFSSLDFGTLSDKQKSEMFTNKIVSQIEEARNNSLIGKSIKISGNEIIPEKWTVTINKSDEKIITKYFYDDNLDDSNPAQEEISEKFDFLYKGESTSSDFKKQEEIFSMSCGNIDGIDEIKVEFKGKDSEIIEPSQCKDKYDLKIISGINAHKFTIKLDIVSTIINSEYGEK